MNASDYPVSFFHYVPGEVPGYGDLIIIDAQNLNLSLEKPAGYPWLKRLELDLPNRFMRLRVGRIRLMLSEGWVFVPPLAFLATVAAAIACALWF